MKLNKSLLLAAIVTGLLVGCSTFNTTQTDTRYDENGKKATSISTKATARTFFDSGSQLANFKATQSEKTQGAEVGSLNQQSSSTNMPATIDAVTRLLQSLK